MIVMYFVVIMLYDVRRIKVGCCDCLLFCWVFLLKENELVWDEFCFQVLNKLMNVWVKFLIYLVIKVVVIIFLFVFFVVGIYGVIVIDENFDRWILVKDDLYLKKFLSVYEQYFKLIIFVSVVVMGDVDYGESLVQDDLKNLVNIVIFNKYYENINLFWIDIFFKYV